MSRGYFSNFVSCNKKYSVSCYFTLNFCQTAYHSPARQAQSRPIQNHQGWSLFCLECLRFGFSAVFWACNDRILVDYYFAILWLCFELLHLHWLIIQTILSRSSSKERGSCSEKFLVHCFVSSSSFDNESETLGCCKRNLKV